MRKFFDTINHPSLIQALRSNGLPDEYVSLLFLLHANQPGTVNRNSAFPIQQGVKQCDSLSAMLFNCVSHTAFDGCRLSLQLERVYILIYIYIYIGPGVSTTGFPSASHTAVLLIALLKQMYHCRFFTAINSGQFVSLG